MTPSLVDQIDALLPQTQCTKCGFDGCRPYAEALAAGLSKPNRCPPGGEQGMLRLSQLLHAQPEPIDPSCGQSGPFKIAMIDEAHCIGCTLCIDACPVDAIVGANKRMHTVIADACTGCELCLPPCPVDCIEMVTAPNKLDWTPARAQIARNRYLIRNARLDRHTTAAATPTVLNTLSKESILEGVMARVKARRANQSDFP